MIHRRHVSRAEWAGGKGARLALNMIGMNDEFDKGRRTRTG